MDVTPLISNRNSVVQSYGPNGFRISGKNYDQNIAVSVLDVTNWTDKAFEDLELEDFTAFFENKPDVLFIGTGQTMLHLPHALKSALKDKKILVETMDTGAACRTFNALMSDGRNICAILYKL